MDALHFIAGLPGRWKAPILLGYAGLSLIVTAVVALDASGVEDQDRRIALAIDCILLMGITAFWLLNSGVMFHNDVLPFLQSEQGGHFFGDALHPLLVKHWSYMHITMGDRRKYKGVYCVLWALVLWFVIAAIAKMELPSGYKIVLVVFAAVPHLLNSISYYLCCEFIWFLKEVSKYGKAEHAPHLDAAPQLSSSYLSLSKVAQYHCLVFFGVSLAYLVVIGLTLYLTPESQRQLACLLLLVAVGLGAVTFAVLFICQKYFLSRLLGIWRDKAAAALEAERLDKADGLQGALERASTSEQYADAIAKIRQPNRFDFADVLTISIAFLSLLASIAMLVQGFSQG